MTTLLLQLIIIVLAVLAIHQARANRRLRRQIQQDDHTFRMLADAYGLLLRQHNIMRQDRDRWSNNFRGLIAHGVHPRGYYPFITLPAPVGWTLEYLN